MAVFVDSEEANSFIGKMFEEAILDPRFIQAAAKSGLVIRLNYTDPDTTMLIDFPGRSVSYGAAAAAATGANVDLYMSCDDAHRFWLGRLNFPAAMARKKLRMEGSTAKALKLLPLTTSLFAGYEKLLTESGRSDLLAKV